MKLQELFEISPRIASLAQRAAAGLGKAGDSLKGPIPLTRTQQEVENMRDEFNTYATQNQKNMTGVDIFTSFVANRKKKNPRDELEINKSKLVKSDGTFDGAYIRSVFADIARAEQEQAKAIANKTPRVARRMKDRMPGATDLGKV